MTFKTTIKTGSAEVATTECGDVTIMTPAGREIGGVTAAYAYDRLHELAEKYCMPHTPRGNGHADDMGRALGAVLKNQLGVIARQEQDSGRVEAFKRERDEACAARDAASRELARVREDLNCARRQMEEARSDLAQLKEYYRGAPPVTKDTPVTLGMLRDLNARGDTLWSARYGSECVTETVLGLALAEKLGAR